MDGLSESELTDKKMREVEAKLTANIEYSTQGTWENLQVAGVDNQEELADLALKILDDVGMTMDIYRIGLQSKLATKDDSSLPNRILSAREAIAQKVSENPKLNDLVELWEMDKYNRSATLAENLLFAVPADEEVSVDRIPEDPLVQEFLVNSGLQDRLAEIGVTTADTMTELFSSISADSSLLDNYSFMSAEDIPEYESLLRKAKLPAGISDLTSEEKSRLVGLAFKLIPTKHRLGIITEEIQQEIISARHKFHEEIGTSNDQFILFDPKLYIPVLSIEDNLLFGRPRLDRPDSREKIDQLIGDIVSEQELRNPILNAGLEFHVGVAGSKLSSGQRKKIALVRVLMKQPKYLILDEVATGSNEEDQNLRKVIRDVVGDGLLIFGTSDLSIASEFENLVIMEKGRITENKPN